MKFYNVFITDLKGQQYMVEFYSKEYENLVELIRDRLYIDFDDCKEHPNGCGCWVELKEPEMVQAHTKNMDSCLLACQIMVDEKLHGQIVKIVKK